jgi:SAM-dependent methyltransferase
LIERAALQARSAIGFSGGETARAGSPDSRANAAPATPAQVPPGAPVRFARKLMPGPLGSECGRSTNLLYERLSAADVAEIEGRLEEVDELRAHYRSAADETTRRHVILAAGIWLGVPAATEKTGLNAAQPPDDVHAMARGPIAAGGGLYEADLVIDALSSAGVEMASVSSALDFGCSSGRVVRVLAAAYPSIGWHGCDPNGPAIAWASESLSGIELFTNGDHPPLPLADGSLDLAYAISIWSHFAPELGLRWMEEMRRILRPGGHLVLTTHGFTSIAFYVIRGLRTPLQSDEIAGALYERGWWYASEFGEQGDWGVVNPDWGTAFLSPEWVLAELCPAWRVLEFAPGRNQQNQDVYVLQRV